MKYKIITSIFLFFFGIMSAYAINSENYLNTYLQINAGSGSTYLIPDGYDLYIVNATVDVDIGGSTTIEVYDDTIIKYDGTFPEGNNFGTYNILFRDSLIINNTGGKNAGILYNGYLIEEGKDFASTFESDGLGKTIFSKVFIDNFFIFQMAIALIILMIVFLIKLMDMPLKKFGFKTSNLSYKLIFGKGKK